MWGDSLIGHVLAVVVAVAAGLVMILIERRRMIKFRSRCERIAMGIESLREDSMAIVSVSSSQDGHEIVSVVAEWTEYLEHSFVNSSLEGAIEDALNYRMKARLRGIK